MKFLDKFQQYFEDSHITLSNTNKNLQNNQTVNENNTLPDHQMMKDTDFLKLIEELDIFFKNNNIKIKLKIYTSFGIEYILAKTYPNISSLINDNFQIDFVNRNNRNLFIIN